MLTIKSEDELNRRINNFAERSFRNIADGDYIAARLACRHQLMDQFKWSAQQAIEKYFKYIFLVNRIPAKINHDIERALSLINDLPFEIELCDETKEFISHIAIYGDDRYLTRSWHITGPVLPKFDKVVWQLRRYCQILDVQGKILPLEEEKLRLQQVEQLKRSSLEHPHRFRLMNGFLEDILDNKIHPAREALVWQNIFFGSTHRLKIKAKDFWQATNSPLSLYPQMHEELDKYVKISKDTHSQCKQLIQNNEDL